MDERKCNQNNEDENVLHKVKNSKMAYLNVIFDHFITVMLSGPLNVTITVPGGPGGPVNPVSPLKER